MYINVYKYKMYIKRKREKELNQLIRFLFISSKRNFLISLIFIKTRLNKNIKYFLNKVLYISFI